MNSRQSLDFAIQVTNGRGVLVLSDQMFFDWVLVKRLDLEIPDIETSLSVAGGAKRFQRRRCRTLAAQIVVEAEGVATWIATRAEALAHAGFHDVCVQLRDGLAELTGHARVGDEEAEFLARVFVEPAERGVRLTLVDARVFGALPVSAHLVVHDVLCALFSVPRWSDTDDGRSARAIGLGDILFRPLDAFLWNVLPPSGWRLPDASEVLAHSVTISPMLAEVAYSSSSTGSSLSATRPSAAAAHLDCIERHRKLDEFILKDDLDRAGKGLARAIEDHPQDARFLFDRLLALLAVQGDAKPVKRLAKEALSRWPDFAPAKMAQAVLALRSGKKREAAKNFQAMAQAAQAADERQEAASATMAVARLLSNDSTNTAKRHKRAFVIDPDDIASAKAPAAIHQRRGDSQKRKGARKRGAKDVPVDAKRLEAHLAAAEASLAISDLDGARVSLEEASALQPADPRPLEGLLQIAEAQDDWELLVDILGRQIRNEEDSFYRARLWYQRAITYRDFLRLEPEAYHALKEAFNCDPEFVEAAQALRSGAMVRAEWSLVAHLLRREIANAPEPIEKAGLHVELSLIHEQRLLDIESAITSYETALKLDPEGPVPPGALARLYALTQRYEEAARAEEKAAYFVKNPAERAERFLRSGEHHERSGKIGEARRMYELAIALPSGGDASAAAMAKLGRLDNADPAKVQALLRSRLTKATDTKEKVGYLRQLLASAISSGEGKEIDSLAQKTLALDAIDVSAFQARRRIAEQKEDWKTLASLYRARAKAVQEPHDKATLYFELGRVCFKRIGDLANAEIALQEVLLHDPKHLGARELLADLAYRRENWDKARQLYSELDPSTSTLGRDAILYRRGELAEMDGDTTGAESAYRAAVDDNPSNLPAHEAIARLALYRGEVTHAITALTDMLERVPLDDVDRVTSTRQKLGELTHKTGDTTAARFYFELVLAEDHSRVAAMMPLVDIYAGQNEWRKGADMLERLSYLVKTPKKRTNLLYRMGEIYRAHLGDDERASDAYLKAIDLDSKHVPTLRRLIDYYWRVGDTKNLEEIVADLEAQNELLVEATLLETIARIGVSMGIAGNKKRASQMGQALGAAGAGALAATLAEVVARDTKSVNDVVSVAHLLCKPPGPFLAAVRQVLEVRGQKDPQARDLAARL